MAVSHVLCKGQSTFLTLCALSCPSYLYGTLATRHEDRCLFSVCNAPVGNTRWDRCLIVPVAQRISCRCGYKCVLAPAVYTYKRLSFVMDTSQALSSSFTGVIILVIFILTCVNLARVNKILKRVSSEVKIFPVESH